MKQENSSITKEQLIEFGMTEPEGDEKLLFPLEKRLTEPNEDGTYMAICVTMMRNTSELCLMLPQGGGCLYLSIANIEQLKTFEQSLSSYESNY